MARAPVMQITPDGDYTQTGVAWNKVGYLSPHHLQKVEAPTRSGLYYFHARSPTPATLLHVSVDRRGRPSRRRPVTAVLASNINWNAYNSFGGRSNYIHANAFPPTPTINSRQELKRYPGRQPSNLGLRPRLRCALSFERPEPLNHIDPREKITDPIEGRSANHLAPAEWRLLGWLEREGFACDLYSETQFHDGLLDLSKYRVLILGPHPGILDADHV